MAKIYKFCISCADCVTSINESPCYRCVDGSEFFPEKDDLNETIIVEVFLISDTTKYIGNVRSFEDGIYRFCEKYNYESPINIKDILKNERKIGKYFDTNISGIDIINTFCIQEVAYTF